MKIRWIQVCFLLTALPQFTEAATVKPLTAKNGEDVTLPCENSGKPHKSCGYTTWNFAASKESVELIQLGKIKDNVGAKKNRLRLTEDCSLVINNVQEEDAGRYVCLQYTPGIIHPESLFQLRVSAGEDTKTTTPAKTSAKPTTTTKTTPAKTSAKTTMIKTTTAQPTTSETATSTPSTTARYSANPQSTTKKTQDKGHSEGQDGLWLYILVAAVAFILTVVVVVKVIRQKGNKTQTGDSPDDPEEGVSYATISYTKNQRKAKGDGKAEDDHVTYSTVKTSSSAAAVGASTDPSSLYSTVNKEKK